ncbi:MAG: putative peptidoglycan glycosyltransferase FtsW [Minisyncoccia bacterium]
MYSHKKIDKIFLITAILLVAIGFLVFVSSSMSVATRENINIYRFVATQLILGVACGSIGAGIIAITKNLDWLKRYSIWIFGFSILMTLAVFTPLGMNHGGASRWRDLGFLSFQPSEFLKIAFLIFMAAYLAVKKGDLSDIRHGLIPFCLITGATGVILILQPDLDGTVTLVVPALAMYIVAGAGWRNIITIVISGVILFCLVLFFKPYAVDRITTFMHPERDSLGSGYQIQQSLIAIGSGGLTGRGFGQSLQKFKYLPESNSDAIFAVVAEELGFVGSSLIIILFVALILRGLRIAIKTSDNFGGLITVGIVILIVTQSFLNIGSMIGVLPLSGLPLTFFSKGGTSLFFILLALGIILNVSKNKKN